MNSPTSNYVKCAGYDIHYMDWGAQHKDAIVMWHGLARTGRDFDIPARHLAGRFRIICPDTIGRGLSQWARDERAYGLDTYAHTACDLLDHLNIENVIWLGTSMGGALGIKLAAGPLKGRITKLILNDIGPEPASASIARIIEYVSNPPSFDTVDELESYLRTIYKPYGFQTEEQWCHMAETSLRRKGDGRLTLHYDPRMIQQLVHHPTDYLLWDEYDSLDVPTLVLRGENSDLLTQETATQMTQRGPKAQVVEVSDCGHAPALNIAEHLTPIAAFINSA